MTNAHSDPVRKIENVNDSKWLAWRMPTEECNHEEFAEIHVRGLRRSCAWSSELEVLIPHLPEIVFSTNYDKFVC